MMHLLLADGIYGIDPQMILYLVILVASVVGGIIQQSKQGKKDEGPPSRGESGEGARPTPRDMPGPVARPAPERRPVPARSPQPPRPRPQRASRATGARLPEIVPRPEPQRRPPPSEPLRAAEVDEPQRAPLPATAAARSTGDAAAIRVQQQRTRLLALLRQRESLRTAFMLQEILGPPVALRDWRSER